MDLIKIETNISETSLKVSLDKIDETVKQASWDGFFWSRLNILVGMWEKGRAIGQYRGVDCPSFISLKKKPAEVNIPSKSGTIFTRRPRTGMSIWK